MSFTQTLGKYEILEELGRGGMGTVYRARDRVLERLVAIKLLHPDPTLPPKSNEGWGRFLNEARAIARLNYPAIVSVYEFSDADPDRTYIAMEYVDGTAIHEYVCCREGARLAPTLDLMRQLLAGISYAHAQGVIHRDIKPSNLLVTRDGRLKITDFGIAKVGSIKHTQTGFMVGTPAYMAPERYTGGPIDRRCDVYSSGVVCYELLTGRRPFKGSLSEIVYQVCHVAPAPVSHGDSGTPALLDPVIAKALAKHPDARYQTAEEFDAALDEVRETLGLGARSRARTAPAGAASDASSSPLPAGATTHVTEFLGAAAPPVEPGSASASAVEPPTDPPPGGSHGDLTDIVRRLTPILGPMAKIVVKRAAARAQDREDLYETLARQLHTDEERKRFLAALSGSTLTDTGAKPSQPTSSTTPQITHDAIAPATLDRAAKILTRYLGPIAFVVVKKTAPAARDEADLYARLSERISDASERARLVAELTRAP